MGLGLESVEAPSVRAGPRMPTAAQTTASLTLPEEKPSQKSSVDAVAMKVKSCHGTAPEGVSGRAPASGC